MLNMSFMFAVTDLILDVDDHFETAGVVILLKKHAPISTHGTLASAGSIRSVLRRKLVFEWR